MRSMNIYVSDDTSDGIITINSDSKFSVARMRKEDVKLYGSALDFPGVYMLLIGDNSVYVGMSDLDTVRNRIMNTHSGDIDSSWHTCAAVDNQAGRFTGIGCDRGTRCGISGTALGAKYLQCLIIFTGFRACTSGRSP